MKRRLVQFFELRQYSDLSQHIEEPQNNIYCLNFFKNFVKNNVNFRTTKLVLSQYQNFSIRYRYQWKSTALGTNFGTKANHKNMLIKKQTIFI